MRLHVHCRLDVAPALNPLAVPVSLPRECYLLEGCVDLDQGVHQRTSSGLHEKGA